MAAPDDRPNAYDLGYLDGRRDTAREFAEMLAALAIESGAINPEDLSRAVGEVVARSEAARAGMPPVPTHEETLHALTGARRMSMNTEDVREVLITAVRLMREQMLSAPLDPDPDSGYTGRRESLEHGVKLEEFLRTVPASDPRLVTIAERVNEPDDIAELLPDDAGLIPGEGSALLDYLAERAQRGED
jgi:hypothetical protein